MATPSFSGSYLNRTWARRFFLSTVLQRYKAAPTLDDKARLMIQQSLSRSWGMGIGARQLDQRSEARILRLLAHYACGEGLLSDEALDELNAATAYLPGPPRALEDPVHMERLLEDIGYVQPGDNLQRVAYAGRLQYDVKAHALMEPYLAPSLQREGGDPFDCIREVCPGPAYAIDGATTSEVDDAIGIEVDAQTGVEVFTVYVSDATVYCPFDSPLDQVTARELTTTTYLPEGVFFMLPKPIVEAATLREDRPCRTFNIRFQIDEATGELHNFSIALGWLERLRRVTYDAVQELLVPPAQSASRHVPPAWFTRDDARRIRRMHAVAQARFHARLKRATAHQKAVIDSSLPDPLIKVEGTRVVSLSDQVICTQDARLAVAELMIAANEVCSRIAQRHGVLIPFRGTQVRSGEHEVALGYTEPVGVRVLLSLDPSHVFMAQAMHRSMRQLSSVTRAIYYHRPLYHAGLDTTDYAHSTSPLRRYADMLVHHQLKLWLWEQSRWRVARSRRACHFMPHQLIPECSMATLCADISLKQERASLLQDSATRYWRLRYVQELQQRQKGEARFWALVGETRDVAASPEYSRLMATAARQVAALRSLEHRIHPCPWPLAPRQLAQSTPEFRYVSELYLPELQLTYTLCHSRPEIVVGAVVECRVAQLQPTQGVLELEPLVAAGDERHQLWMGAVVPLLDS